MRDMRLTRQRFIWGGLVAAAAVLAGPSAGRAQDITGTMPFTAGEDGGFQAPINTSPAPHLPTGRAGAAGFYTAFEFVMLNQTRAIGDQTVAFRGFWDNTGTIANRLPGAFIGSGNPALRTDNLSPVTWQPGFKAEIGYRFDGGERIFFNYLQLFERRYTQGATLVPPYFQSTPDLADTFISAPVYNFTTPFAGPGNKVGNTPDFSVYGVWNGASEMVISFQQQYQEMNLGVRVPLLQTDYSRVYGIAAARFAWFFERFRWRSVSYDEFGNTNPHFAADYSNTLSQRMYGPLLGCGHEIFVANQFSLSLDLTGAVLIDVAKTRAKYVLGDKSVQSPKYSRDEYRIVPNANAEFNLWWYPTEGVQVRVGYQVMTYYNTLYMDQPVGYNFGQIDPGYDTKWFRMVQGFNVGVGFFF
jgi:hypothetical protein